MWRWMRVSVGSGFGFRSYSLDFIPARQLFLFLSSDNPEAQIDINLFNVQSN